MTDFTIASFNVKNLIGADQEYYRYESYTPEEHAWKADWLADQILTMDADIICFQEIFEEDALRSVIAEADVRGVAANEATVPDASKRYHRKAIFRKLRYTPYTDAQLAFAQNVSDGGPGQRRPGVAVLSRFGFAEAPEIIHALPKPRDVPFRDLTGEDAGHYRLTRISRPILKVRVPVGDQVVTVFNCHLKSKLGEYPPGADGGCLAILSWSLAISTMGNTLSVQKSSQANTRLRTMLGCGATMPNTVLIVTRTPKTLRSVKLLKPCVCIRPRNSSSRSPFATWFTPPPLEGCLKASTKSSCHAISCLNTGTTLAKCSTFQCSTTTSPMAVTQKLRTINSPPTMAKLLHIWC